MTGHEHSTPISLQSTGQLSNTGQIQIVGRLIQQQHIGSFHQQRHQAQQNTLPTGKTTNGPVQNDMAQTQSSRQV